MTVSHQTFARKKPEQLVYLELGSGNGGMLLSISEDGFRFRAVTPLRANHLVPFAFSLDGSHRLQGIGEVEWLEDDGKSGGMRFSEMSDESRSLLNTWLALGDQRQRAPGREATPAAATALDTMEKIREELRRGYPARPSSEGHSKPAEQQKIEKPQRGSRPIPRPNRALPENSPTRQEQRVEPQRSAFHKRPEPIEEADPKLPPPPTAVPILERLMGPRRPAHPEAEVPAEQSAESSPAFAPATDEPPAIPPGPPPFTKPADSPTPVRAPFSISAFLKGNRETSRAQRDAATPSAVSTDSASAEILPANPGSAAPPPPPTEAAEPVPTLRSFALSDSAQSRISSPASPLAPASRPYVPPPDSSFDAAWEHAKLTTPPEAPHLSRAAASAIIGLALALIIGALAYNFRQDIGGIIIGVGQKVSGDAHSAQADSSGVTTQPGSSDPAASNQTQPADTAGPNVKPAESNAQPGPSAVPVPSTSLPVGSKASLSSSPNPGSAKTPGNLSSSSGQASKSPPVSSPSNNKDAALASQRPATQGGSAPADSSEQSPDASAPAGSGQEEFNAARDILKGPNHQRDLQTAVALLWSGVRKGYVPAEVTLADMYRRGEGVEKNCDQAQVLLVAASRKGSPDARRQLESMAEQGCQ